MIQDVRLRVEKHEAGSRLDLFLARRFPTTTRALILRALQRGEIRVSEGSAAKGRRLDAGIEVYIARLLEKEDWHALPNPELPLVVLNEDKRFLALDKPSGLPVNPLDPEETRCLASALIARYPELSKIGPDPLLPAIVHRLDTDTSGVVLAARDDEAYRYFRAQFRQGKVHKVYLALVHGAVHSPRRVEQRLAHTWADGHRMKPVLRGGLRAITEYEPLRQLRSFTLVRVRMRTGVTHQIRCALASEGHPIAGDDLYGSRTTAYRGRLFLHAAQITFSHPDTGRLVTIESPLPSDLTDVLAELGP